MRKTTMMNRKGLKGVWLLTCLFLTGVWCKNDAAFVYSRIGGDILLPCSNLKASNCSLISWSFYGGVQVRFTYEVREGQMRADTDKANRLSVTSNCSLLLHDLMLDDIGTYRCLWQEEPVYDVYLSLLTITAFSKITDLHPGGNLILSCHISTFFDLGSCRSYSNEFRLSWVMENGTELPRESRYELIAPTRCNITLVTKLQREDNNRKWRCQVNPTNHSRAAFQDFTSAFLFENPSTGEDPIPSPVSDCEVQLPISSVVLCVALPIMVIIVGFFTWRKDSVRGKALADAGI
ncbi:uncharacterized protein LOC131462928 [Solea solea]|uniref:uncharacterized protein LOC131462928 n=1 Tax=Solea solea TaxID=90069 RepID=UPI00272A86E8|nr:uncharacterized protein LOC131462928 [Solea solea]